MLSPIGKAVVQLRSFNAAFDAEKHATLIIANNKDDAKVSLRGGVKGGGVLI